tara:strand:- start:1368 stop:2276 length:909 start_codon:yes stop_codon:yes gene_type:complete
MKKILVTGATGFLGRHLVKKLSSENSKVFISNTKNGNLHDYEGFCNYFGNIKFDYIYHLAAKTKAGDYCLTHKGEQWIDNQILNTNILKYWVEKQSQAKIIAMGTSCMFEPSDKPLEEKNCLDGNPDEGLATYAFTKRMLLIGLQSIAEQYGLEYTYFIPSTLYGTDFDLNDSHFIFDLVKKIYNGKHCGDDVILWGDGYQRRELIFIDDVVKMMWDLRDEKNEIINLGSGMDNSIREFASYVCKYIEYDESKIHYDTTKYVGTNVKIMSPNKLKSYGFDFTSLDHGIKKIVNYYFDRRSSK